MHLEFKLKRVRSIRFGWIVAQVGTALALALIFYCAIGVSLTMASISSIASNDLPPGGVFSVLTTALGTGIGTSITLLYGFGVIVFSAIEIIGSVTALIAVTRIQLTQSFYWDRVLLSLGALLTLYVLGLLGQKVIHRVSILILLLLALSFISIFLGFLIGNLQLGIAGPSLDVFVSNFLPPAHSNATGALAFLFPCFIGIYSGTNRASLLKQPFVSIRNGGFISIAISTFFYICLVVGLSFAIPRYLLNQDLFITMKLAWPTQYLAFGGVLVVGLGSALQCTTISSKLLHSLVESETILNLRNPHWLVTWRRQPTISLTIVSLLTLCFIFLSDLEWLALIVSMAFLLSYALTNVSCALLSFFRTPSWRPHFPIHWSISLMGFLWTILVMSQLQAMTALLVSILAISLAIWIQASAEYASWGTGIHGLLFHLVLTDLLQHEEDEFKQTLENRIVTKHEAWKPQILCFVHYHDVLSHSRLINFVHSLKMKTGLCILSSVVTVDDVQNYKMLHPDVRKELLFETDARLQSMETDDLVVQLRSYLFQKMAMERVQGFVKVCVAPTVQLGQSILLQTLGLGGLTANTIVTDWPRMEPIDEAFVRVRELFQLWTQAQILDLTSIVCKGISRFPSKDVKLAGYIDVWWMMDVSQGTVLLASG